MPNSRQHAKTQNDCRFGFWSPSQSYPISVRDCVLDELGGYSIKYLNFHPEVSCNKADWYEYEGQLSELLNLTALL